MKILGITRGAIYSPNLADSDAAILNSVADNLRAMGHEVDIITEYKMDGADFDRYDRVFGMERDIRNIKKIIGPLSEENYAKFINSIHGIIACSMKGHVYSALKHLGVPQPSFIFFQEDDKNGGFKMMDKLVVEPMGMDTPLWMKNGDTSATVASDTVYCADDNDGNAAVEDFCKRNLQCFIMQKHVEGDLIKFYGVEGTDFFHWQYASHGHSKFGLEKINGKEKGYAFDPNDIKKAVEKLAAYIDVPIYGGDAVIDGNGNFYVIDFNDFPSFSACRDEAAQAIAQRIVR